MSFQYVNQVNYRVNWQPQFRFPRRYYSGMNSSPSDKITSYPLLNMPALVLDQIFTKCTFPSYQRLQQTCRYIKEFIESSKTIRIHLRTDRRVSCYQRGSAFMLTDFTRPFRYNDVWDLAASADQVPYRNSPNLQDLYGIRFRILNIVQNFYETENGLDKFLETLEKNRIRCDNISVCAFGWTIEQFETLIKIVKPLTVDMVSECSSHYEILLNAKGVRKICIRICHDEFFLFVRRIMTTFSSVNISLVNRYNPDLDETLKYCDKILEILHTEAPQQLRDFYFTNLFGPRYPTVDELEEHFRKFNPRVEESSEPHYSISAWVDLPESLSSNAFCKIRFGNGGAYTSATINYRKTCIIGPPCKRGPTTSQ